MSDNSEIIPTSNNKEIFESLLYTYNNDPITRGLIRLLMTNIPFGIGSAFDAYLTNKINQIRAEKLRTFFDELQSEKIKLTEEIIQREDFLFSYFATLKASINQNREQKIRLFARLLRNAVSFDKLGTDEFCEFLSILDDISLRELEILIILKEIHEENSDLLLDKSKSSESDNELQIAMGYWDKFESEILLKCSIDSQRLRAMLNRLNRTGLYESFVGGYIGYTGGMGFLTNLFDDFCNWLELKSDAFISNI